MKKLLIGLIFILVCVLSAIGFAACNNTADTRNPQIVKIYNAYVVYAEENDITPLSYEAWLLSIKGDKGDKGEDGFTPTVEISDDGYWVVNGIRTDRKSQGETGKAAIVEISADGYWVINGEKTDDKATDADGKTYYDFYVEFPVWRETDDADDYDGDREITFADYIYFKEYERWKLSGNAYDYDKDKRITMEDYKFYNDPQNLNLIYWLNSDLAYDYNNDRFVDKLDFIFYNNYKHLVGKFKVVNFKLQQNDIQGQNRSIFLNKNYSLNNLAQDIGDFDLEVSKNLTLICIYGDMVKQKLGDDEVAVQNAINSCAFDKLSDTVTTVSFTLQGLDFTVYLTKTESGFSSSVNIAIDGITANCTFDITYVD